MHAVSLRLENIIYRVLQAHKILKESVRANELRE